jgi:hypothetical protein
VLLFQLSDVVAAAALSESTDTSISVIVTEMQKSHPDIKLICDKMSLTSGFRQKLCLEKPTATVLESFPCLRMHLFVSLHFSANK